MKKMHKLDSIFMIGIIVIAILGMVVDYFYWKDVEEGGFPVFTCISVFVSYALWIILLIYSSIKYKKKEEKPKLVRWYMYFLLPTYHIAVMLIGLLLASLLMNIFNI